MGRRQRLPPYVLLVRFQGITVTLGCSVYVCTAVVVGNDITTLIESNGQQMEEEMGKCRGNVLVFHCTEF